MCVSLGHFHVVGGKDAGSGADYASPENTVQLDSKRGKMMEK
jgi:hypothetical protein